MKTIHTRVLAAAALAIGLGGCADMSARDKNTALGAGIGGVTGAILTNGNPIGAVGGAALGGYIGNQNSTGKK